MFSKIYCVVEHTGHGYIVRHVYFNEKKANAMKVLCQGLSTDRIWEIKSFEILDANGHNRFIRS